MYSIYSDTTLCLLIYSRYSRLLLVRVWEGGRDTNTILKGLSPYLLTRDPGSSASSLAICLVL